jgi:hypothetical protein
MSRETKDLNYEERQRILDPHRREEQQRMRTEAEARLATRNIRVESGDDDEEVADLLDAIERFEHAVERRGGDLMINQIGSSEPENPDFVPPVRLSGESLRDYMGRISEARNKVEQEG